MFPLFSLFQSIVALLALSFPHPHVPKAIVMQGAGGKTTLMYFTVPYNPEQVKNLPNGTEWHLGYAALEVGMPMMAGTTRIPVGTYKFNVLHDAEGGFTKFVLVPADLLAASRAPRGQQPDAQKLAAVKADLAAKGIPERIEFACETVPGKDAEHFGFAMMTEGYEATKRGSAEPKGGASFTLFANFGNLHRSAELVEEFPVKETAKDGGR
ncbi:MAG: hypothetical protein U1F36_04685 [Planctomycetota bacterium]